MKTLQQQAADHETAKQESFERCDTDGFVSQWAHGINAQLLRTQAKLEETDNKSEFPGLFLRSTGDRVKAKLIKGRFGLCWAFVGEEDKFTGEFLSNTTTKRGKLYKQGYEVRPEMADAKAIITGNGTGLAGAASCYVTVIRSDKGYPEETK